jgi:cephalosporin-C deacetylase-like acetyl esterase
VNDHLMAKERNRMHRSKAHYRFWLILVLAWIVGIRCSNEVDNNLIQVSNLLPESIPWDLKYLSEAPEFEWAGENPLQSLYYEGEPYKGKSTRVFAYYATPGSISGDPSKDKNLPAIVLVHGGGGTAFHEWVHLWAERGYAAIAMDLAGYGPKRERLIDGGPDQRDSIKFGQIEKPLTDQWMYHAVANVIRAHSLIRSFPEVNSNRTGLIGISWGGYLTCIVAGLDNRFKAAIPIYGCGFLYENSYWLHEFEKMSTENKARWIRYWDPSQYVGSTTIPMFFVNGGTDFAYPPDSHARTYDLVQSQKNIHFIPFLNHGHIFDRPKETEVFIEQHLNGGIPLPKFSSVNVRGNRVEAKVESRTKLVSAELHYTLEKSSGNPKNRTWFKLSARIEQNNIISELPPEDAQIWFLTVVDEHEMLVSSKLIFK